MFDNFRLSPIYDPFLGDYQIFSIDETHALDEKHIHLSTLYPPYKRLLCWRLKKAIILFSYQLRPSATAIIDVIDFTETFSTVDIVEVDEVASTSQDDEN